MIHESEFLILHVAVEGDKMKNWKNWFSLIVCKSKKPSIPKMQLILLSCCHIPVSDVMDIGIAVNIYNMFIYVHIIIKETFNVIFLVIDFCKIN